MFVFILKQHPESFAFLFPRILKLFAREVWTFLKKLIFNITALKMKFSKKDFFS